MFLLKNSISNVIRNKNKSIICILISMIMILLLNIYIGNIYNVIMQIEELGQVMPVFCYISNLNGSQTVGLEIKEDIYEKLLQSENVKQMKSSLSLIAGVGQFSIDEYKEHLHINVIAMNDISAFREESEDIFVMEESSDISFLGQNINECLVSEQMMKINGWEIGQSIPLNLYYYQHGFYNDLTIEPLEIQEYIIVGSIKETLSDTQEEVQIILPLESVKEIFERLKIPFYTATASFYVTDPLKLNEFKDEMKSYGLLPVIPKADFSTDGNALTVKDTTFISAATELREEEHLLNRFLLLIFLLIILVGYVTSSLLMQSRKSEFRLMRIMGIGRGTAVLTFLLEQCILFIVGLLLGMVITLAYQGLQFIIQIASGVLGISYCLGSLIALIGISRENIMENRI